MRLPTLSNRGSGRRLRSIALMSRRQRSPVATVAAPISATNAMGLTIAVTRLPPRPARGSLLQEGGDALGGVRAREEPHELAALGLEPLGERAVEPLSDSPL